jgi:hypothetical protein
MHLIFSVQGSYVVLRNYLLSCASLFLLPPPTAPQWTPVVAKIRQTTEDIKDGRVSKRDVKEGYYFRAQDGSVLTKWTTLNGHERVVGELFDNNTARSYKLDYASGTALPLPPSDVKFGTLSPGMFKSQELNAIGHDSVSGVTCYLIPVQLQFKSRPPRRVGESCVSADYDLQLRTDMTNGDAKFAVRELIEMYDIQIGEVPDPQLFDVKAHFRVAAQ